MTWNKKDATARIAAAVEQLSSIDIRPLTSSGQLDNIGLAEALRVDATHVYVDILNAPDLLDTDRTESERSHKRLLRFLHVYQRAAQLVVGATTARTVDFQNHRLHFLVAEPFRDERARLTVAIAVAHTLVRVLREANELHPELPDARVRVGIDTGPALAVQNGTRGDREPLYLGNPANRAAKLLVGRREGIYLTDEARRGLGPAWAVLDPTGTPLTADQVDSCVRASGVRLDVDALCARWREEVQKTPLATFEFTRPRPPLSALTLDELTPKNSRRIDAAVLYADVDGFTRYVAARVTRREGEAAAVRALHVIRKELRDVLVAFGGRKIRYNGDCLVGVLAEGADTTSRADTMGRAALCAAAMRSSFELIQARLPDTSELGLAIGIDAGPVSITRLGPRLERYRCIVGGAVVEAEAIQQRCTGKETGVAPGGHAWASDAVKALLPSGRPAPGLHYNLVYATLDGKQDAAVASVAAIPSIRPKAYGG